MSTTEVVDAPYESTTTAINRYDDTIGRFDQYKYNDTAVNTNSLEETNYYLEKSATNIYKDPNPKIIRRARSESPVTLEQRIFVRYFQPPPVLPPGVMK